MSGISHKNSLNRFDLLLISSSSSPAAPSDVFVRMKQNPNLLSNLCANKKLDFSVKTKATE